MARVKLTLSCAPTAERFPVGGPLTVRLTLRNDSADPVEIPAVSLPWHSFYAAVFKVRNRSEFERVLPEGLPLELPAKRVEPGGTLSGEVDLGAYLRLRGGGSIADAPGRFEVTGVVLASAKPAGADKLEDVKLRCGPFTVTVG